MDAGSLRVQASARESERMRERSCCSSEGEYDERFPAISARCATFACWLALAQTSNLEPHDVSFQLTSYASKA